MLAAGDVGQRQAGECNGRGVQAAALVVGQEHAVDVVPQQIELHGERPRELYPRGMAPLWTRAHRGDHRYETSDFAHEEKVRQEQLDRYYLTRVTRTHDRSAMILSRKGNQPSEGLQIQLPFAENSWLE